MKNKVTKFLASVVFVTITASLSLAADAGKAASGAEPAKAGGDTKEWTQWGGSSARNNTPEGHNIPTEWAIGEIDYKTGEWKPEKAKNVKWVARLGSQTYGNTVVAGGKAFIGTNNSAGWLKRYPADKDLGCLLCFDIKDGKFLWQHSSEKLPTGRVHDWPLQGVCSTPLVEGDRLWFVTNRGEVRCLDTEGFNDGENDGPYKDEPNNNKDEADVVWVFDMMKELGVSQHNMADCSVTSAGDTLFVCTSNGVDEAHNGIPAPKAPSFVAMNKNTKDILWTDASPGVNVLHGQWSSPSYGVLGGVPQVLFGGGDGYLYSFAPEGDGKGGAKLLWKFDCNPKTSHYALNKATRNHIIGTPVIYDGLVYVAVGEDPEHGEGTGHLWCIDPTKRGDVSPELAYNSADPSKPIAHKRIQAVEPEKGDFARPNPNTAAVWHYSEFDENGDKKIEFSEIMHRTLGSVVIKDNVLYIADYSGVFHCLDAKTGKRNWVYDMLSASWGSPLVVDGKVYIGDEDGDVAIFKHSADPNVAMKDDGGEMKPFYGEINMGNSVYSTPIVADNVLYIANRTHLFAIENKDNSEK
ncbi:MAG: PQQ-binding-like beta-propeller repeat protein [Pirellulales bacterium]